MWTTCLEKQAAIKALFSHCQSADEKYAQLIALGKRQERLPVDLKTEAHRVSGCQSLLYLSSYFENGVIIFQTESDALISAGLAVLLTSVYSGETPEVILKCPPTYLAELEIGASLTPNRANGLSQIHLRMQRDALRFLIAAARQPLTPSESPSAVIYSAENR